MSYKLLGILDFACGFSIIFNDSVPQGIIGFLGLILLLKGSGFAFMGDFISYIDVICAFYMLTLSLGFYNLAFSIFCAVFLMQKAVLTFFA